jgi:hypothetical protein
MWFNRNNNFPDATFVDYGACRAFAVAARMLPIHAALIAQAPALADALRDIAKQKTSGEWESEFGEEFSGDFVSGYDKIIAIARAALAEKDAR